MTMIPEQLASAHKHQVDVWFGLTAQAFEGADKLLQLNIAAARALLADGHNQAKQSLDVQDPREWLALQSSNAQPLTEKATSYAQQVYQIVTATQAEFVRAFEAQAQAQQARTEQILDSFSRNAPAGSETAVAAVKSALNAQNAAYESARKAAKQVVELAQSNIDAVTAAAVHTSQQAAAATNRTAKASKAV
ncbi:phasin family protein [Robbsia sp. KACC 23696]|uniref:phasin family protein n=1 Tax=Robbsia sp. KACC 23696 TaxID=3149231 RepID=UPI00325A810D